MYPNYSELVMPRCEMLAHITREKIQQLSDTHNEFDKTGVVW
jgi:hypothetical protein